MRDDGQDTVLVVGADGMIGGGLAAALAAEGRSVWRTTRRADSAGRRLRLDLGAADWPALPAPPAVAFLCAAVTSQEHCRRAPATSRQVNVVGAVALARRLAEAGAFVVFPSTNLVFDGEAPWPGPQDPVNPQTEYGRQKAEAEARLAELGGQVAVVRLTKVLGPDAPLLRGWIDDLRAGKAIHPFADMPLAPVPLAFALEALLKVAARRLPGIVQVSAGHDLGYAQAARHIARRLAADPALVQPIPRPAADFAPRHTALDAGRLRAECGLQAPEPLAAIDAVVAPALGVAERP